MKAISGILFLAVLMVSTYALGEMPNARALKLELTYLDAKKQIGYVETYEPLVCHPLNNSKKFYVNREYYLNSEKVTERLTKSKLIRTLLIYPKYKNFYFYKNMTKLNYFPAGFEVDERMSQWAFSPENHLIDAKNIKSISILNCWDLQQVAPVIDSISNETVKRLTRPSLAVYTEEFPRYSVGMLISYNQKYDSADKLNNLLEQFSKKYPSPENDQQFPNASFFLSKEKIRKLYLPKDVVSLSYYVGD